jgi:hypothetical protein
VYRPISPSADSRARLWLAAIDGRRVERPIAPLGSPEKPMAVRFEGLTEDQQRAALAAFPGGKRFVLAS